MTELPTTTYSIIQLPEEILSEILAYLNYKDLLRCCMLCKRIGDIINHSSRLLYTVELAVAGRVVNDTCDNLPASTLLAELTSTERLWNDACVGLSVYETMKLPRNRVQSWEFAGGVYVRVSELRQSRSVGVDQEESIVETYDLGYIKDSIPAYVWTFPKRFGSFTVDPGAHAFFGLYRNSLMSTEAELHVLSIQNGRPLPDIAPFSFNIEGQMHGTRNISSSIHVCGRFLAVHMQHRAPPPADLGEPFLPDTFSILIIDWQQRQVQFRIEETDWPTSCFLSQTSFLTATIHNGSCCVKVFRIDETFEGRAVSLKPRAIFLFPSMLRTARGHTGVTLRFSPPTDRSNGCAADDTLPYDVFPPELQLLAVEITLLPGFDGMSTCRYTFCTIAEAFVDYGSYLQLLGNGGSLNPDTCRDASQIPVIPWETWGPRNTRCFANLPSYDRNIYGWRLALSNCIFSFNPLSIARDLCNAPDSFECVEGLVLQPTIIPSGVFVNDVITTLPYRVSGFRDRFSDRIHRIMLDEDIIGIAFDEAGHETLHVIGLADTMEIYNEKIQL